MCDLGPAISTPIRNLECRAWRLYHEQRMVIRDSFRRFILPGLFRIGVNGVMGSLEGTKGAGHEELFGFHDAPQYTQACEQVQ